MARYKCVSIPRSLSSPPPPTSSMRESMINLPPSPGAVVLVGWFQYQVSIGSTRFKEGVQKVMDFVAGFLNGSRVCLGIFRGFVKAL